MDLDNLQCKVDPTNKALDKREEAVLSVPDKNSFGNTSLWQGGLGLDDL